MNRTLIAAILLSVASITFAQSADTKSFTPAELKQHDTQVVSNFPNYNRYQAANAQLTPPAAKENRIVFMGDSITDGWKFNTYFSGKPYINRGISGQTTRQMLLRFRPDVIALKPKAVVILAGTNDFAGNTGPETPEEIQANLSSMADLAKANGIRVVFCSILPAFDFGWHPGQEPAQKIVALNQWLKSYAAEKGYTYVDYHSAMKDQRDGLPETLSKDGVHPNPAGYTIMAPLAEAGIKTALKKH